MRLHDLLTESKVLTVGTDTPVRVNPNAADTARMLERSEWGDLRFLIDDALYAWDAFEGTHDDMAALLGVAFSGGRLAAGDLLTGILTLDGDRVILHHVNQDNSGGLARRVFDHPLFQRATRGLTVVLATRHEGGRPVV